MSEEGDPGPINSLGRTVQFAPIAGSFGYVEIIMYKAGTEQVLGGPVQLNVMRWSPQQAVQDLPVNNFNTPVDDNNTPHEESIAGIMRSSFRVAGVRDAGNIGYHPTPGDQGFAYLGYDEFHYFQFYFFVLDIGGEQNIEGVAALEFSIKAVGLCLMAGSTGGSQNTGFDAGLA
jgi:hypothetical protein